MKDKSWKREYQVRIVISTMSLM